MLKKFDSILGLRTSIKKERAKFVERIKLRIYPRIEDDADYERIFDSLMFDIGGNPLNYQLYAGEKIPLERIAGNDFGTTLRVLVILYNHFVFEPDIQKEISFWIGYALKQARLDLGFSWNEKDGIFYKSGAKELDKALIDESLGWLDRYKNEKTDFKNALEKHTKNEYGEVVGSCYNVLEGMARKVLGNEKSLDNNKERLLAKLGLGKEWKAFLAQFIRYANEFKRHAAEGRHDFKPQEVEAFLYLTGLLVRLIAQSA